MTRSPRVALIHATTIAVEPIKSAFEASWPEAERVNILEDSLSPDRERDGCISEAMVARIEALTRYAKMIGSDAVLFTCSSFGSAIARAATLVDIPVLKPNEAMFEAAIKAGGRTAMLYTFPPALSTMEDEFREEAARSKSGAEITSVLVEGAIEAVRRGDIEAHNGLIAKAAGGLEGFDSIVLAHFSTARAVGSVKDVTKIPVLSSPEAAVAKLKRLLVQA